jgi:hypothetical protein
MRNKLALYATTDCAAADCPEDGDLKPVKSYGIQIPVSKAALRLTLRAMIVIGTASSPAHLGWWMIFIPLIVK